MDAMKNVVNYQRNVPRCGTCKYLVSYMKEKMNHKCSLHNFMVAKNSVCDTWMNSKGEVLDV